jgi:hypothetical protein
MSREDRNLEEELGPSPHPAFADMGEPWKDAKLMLKLDELHDYQYEIAHILGCDDSKISYWMQKAEENWEPVVGEEEFECIFFKVCNRMAHSEGGICDTCLDLVRHHDSVQDIQSSCGEGEQEKLHHVQNLYDHYDGYEVATP